MERFLIWVYRVTFDRSKEVHPYIYTDFLQSKAVRQAYRQGRFHAVLMAEIRAIQFGKNELYGFYYE